MGKIHVVEVCNVDIAEEAALAIISATIIHWNLGTLEVSECDEDILDKLIELGIFKRGPHGSLVVDVNAKKVYDIDENKIVILLYDEGGFWKVLSITGEDDELSAVEYQLSQYNLAWPRNC